jgi:LmbE family N-acetylglucosaminyl deacetylase
MKETDMTYASDTLDAPRVPRRRQTSPLKLLAVVAHPDDESLALGGILARYAAEGVETSLVTATRGQRGWFGPPDENPGLDALGRIREGELREAAKVLGISDLVLLDYVDGDVADADEAVLLRQIAAEIRRIRPDVVVTFDHNGIYGHPDHIAVTRAATAAIVAAGDPNFECDTADAPHAAAKLYYFAWTQECQVAYERAFGELRWEIDGIERHVVPWPHWTISTWIDTSEHWERVWDAIRCHRTQLPEYQKLLDLPDEFHLALWGRPTFHRVFSTVPAGAKEDDLVAGLRTGGDDE